MDIYAVQETWREGSGVETNKGHTFIRVGNDGADRMAVAGAKAGRGDQAAIQRIALRSPRPAP